MTDGIVPIPIPDTLILLVLIGKPPFPSTLSPIIVNSISLIDPFQPIR